MNRKTLILPVLVGVCLAVGVYTLKSTRARQNTATDQSKQPVLYTQGVTSCAKDIRVIKAEVIDVGTPSSRIEVQVENLSDRGIIAISLEATNGISSYTTTKRSSFKKGMPVVVIKPHETETLTMTSPFGDVPLQIGGVLYQDGTEEGCTSSLKTLHEVKESEEKKEPLNEKNPNIPGPSSP